eukprot:s55_g28.t1
MAPSPTFAAKRFAVFPREPGSSSDAMNWDGGLISYIGSRYGMSNFVNLLDLKTYWSGNVGFETQTESWLRFAQFWCTWGGGTFDL